jgi:hypothetical protein
MTWRSLPLLVTACLLASGGCSAPEEVGVAGFAIMGGAPDSADTSVVGIYDLKLNSICTGSLIAPNVVLTARHCIAPVLNADPQGGILCGLTTFGAPVAPDHFVVTTKQDIFDTSADRHVREIATPPSAAFCGNDVALLFLSSSIVPPEATAIVPRIDEAVVPMEGYSAIGYGAIDDSPGGTGAGTRRRRDGLFVNCVSDACPKAVGKPEVAETEWLGDQGVCHGDSGGPAVDSVARVIGVTSRGGSSCATPVYGYVFDWAQWLKDNAVVAAGQDGIDPPPWATGWTTNPDYSYPVGAPCKQPEDCVSGRCINDTIATYCTRLCNDQAPCEQGYTCDTQDTQACIQIHSPMKNPEPPPKSGGCSVAPCSRVDPQNPTPWALLALALVRRRPGRSARRS